MNQNPAGNSTLTIAPGRVPDGLLMIWTTSEFGCWKRILSQHALHHGLLGHFPGHFPRILGHQPVGEIVAVAPDVTSRKVGDRVGTAWVQATCGRCEWCQ